MRSTAVVVVLIGFFTTPRSEASFENSAAAETAATSAKQRVRDAQRCQADAEAAVKAINAETVKDAKTHADLMAERDRVLRELREGLFCSRCGQSKSEIEGATGEPFEKHLRSVQGKAIPAPQTLIERRDHEFIEKINAVVSRLHEQKERAVSTMMRHGRCYADEERAHAELWYAVLWAERLKKDEAHGQKTNKFRGSPKLDADKFGLGPNTTSSEFGALRVAMQDGSVLTLPPGWSLSKPDQIKRIQTHHGIDFTSRDAKGQPASLPFTAGFKGTAHVIIGSQFNTVEVELPNKNRLQFLHASQVNVRDGDTVTPTTLIGFTGNTGAQATHLHLQARDANGLLIDPAIAVLEKSDPRSMLAEEAQQRASAALPPYQPLSWHYALAP